jgi:hypothetical protein
MVQQLGLSGGPDSPEAPSPVGSRPSPTTNSKQLVTVEHDDEDMEDEGRSASGSRWPRQETLALIKLRSDMDANFRDSGLKGPLWEEVSRYVIVHEVQADFFPSHRSFSSSSSSPPSSWLLSVGMTIKRGDVCQSVPSIFACLASPFVWVSSLNPKKIFFVYK